MTDHDDTQFDAALEALARPDAPSDHVARVLARTSAESLGSRVDARGGLLVSYLRPRWVLPVAATVLVVLGVTWQGERQVRDRLDDVMTMDASHPSGAVSDWGGPEEVVQPVLPPQAYWGMDPVAKFATPRTGTQEYRNTGAQVSSAGRQGRGGATDDELTLAPEPSGLPPIELVSFTPSPLVAATVAAVEDITLAEIPLAPIVIAPVDDQERP